MKKIISLLLATMMIVSFSAVSFAAGTMTVAGSSKTVAVNATGADANVDVTFTFNFPEEVSIIGFQPEIAYDKTALTLNTYKLSNIADNWTTTDSNLNASYGAFLSFDDPDFAGSSASSFTLTLNFTVNNTATNGEVNNVTVQKLVGTDINWSGLGDTYTIDLSGAKSTITVGSSEPVTPPATTVEKAVQATVTSYKEGMTGVLFTAVDGSNKGQYVVRFNGTIESGEVKVGLKVTGVPATNNLTITAENYYGTANTGVLK